MVYSLLLLVLSMIPSSQGVKVFDYREPFISNAFNNNSNPFDYPSLDVAAVANTSNQDSMTYSQSNLTRFRRASSGEVIHGPKQGFSLVACLCGYFFS
jgi:hypothetical protein